MPIGCARTFWSIGVACGKPRTNKAVQKTRVRPPRAEDRAVA
jgi:hypothetical protein